jgi:hypothetical protein
MEKQKTASKETKQKKKAIMKECGIKYGMDLTEEDLKCLLEKSLVNPDILADTIEEVKEGLEDKKKEEVKE